MIIAIREWWQVGYEEEVDIEEGFSVEDEEIEYEDSNI